MNLKYLLLYIKDSFEFNDDDWKTKAVEFIARGLEKIGCTPTYKVVVEEHTFTDYRLELPTDVNYLIEVEDDNCCYIPVVNSTSLLDECKCCINKCPDSVYANYDNGFLHFSIETATIKLRYYTLPLDDDGFPLIPDDADVIEALTWWVMYKMITRGYKHHTITNWKEAYQMWKDLYPAAQNSLKHPTVAQMKEFGALWTDAVYGKNAYLYI